MATQDRAGRARNRWALPATLASLSCLLVLAMAAIPGASPPGVEESPTAATDAAIARLTHRLEEVVRRLDEDESRRSARLALLEEDLRNRAGLAQRALTEAVADETRAELRERFAAYEKLLEEIAFRQDERQFSEIEQLESRLHAIVSRLDEQTVSIAKAADRDLARFRHIQRANERGIYLIHCRFEYVIVDADGEEEVQTGDGWGTGFLADEVGHVITNKHVVQPWKFDAEIATMQALGDVRIREDSVRISAWPTGTEFITGEREPDPARGLHTGEGGGLELIHTAPDSWRERRTDFGLGEINYRTHALDDRDLAVLRVRPALAPHRPLPLAESTAAAGLSPLDPVLTIGFPRGMRGLEGNRALTSPSLGTVRKIEKTIHVTASIIPGNSGGPLFDREGRVVGIATRVYSETLGICIQIDRVQELLREVRSRPVKLRPATRR